MRTIHPGTVGHTTHAAEGYWWSRSLLPTVTRILSWVGIGAVFFLNAATVLSQPDIRISRVDVLWPQISVWFSLDCDGIPTFEFSKFDLSLHENGIPVGNFTLDCGDSIPPCPLSAALVFDASGSMAGIGIFDAKEAGKAFLEAMDETRDEACVIAFGSFVRTIQPLTSSRSLLNAAIDSIEAMGATALIDGAYRGIEELARHATRSCKVVIVLSDGG
ncbi:MAG: VWA domain-containing protein, partial [Bacteroidota bacterium]|nr:VWA domain-containing protein [Bacteroidota bacterium]